MTNIMSQLFENDYVKQYNIISETKIGDYIKNNNLSKEDALSDKHVEQLRKITKLGDETKPAIKKYFDKKH